MLRNYLLTALRSLKKNPLFSIINIAGLSIGMSATIIILLWVADEMRYDRFYKNIDEIYRVYEHRVYKDSDDRFMYNTPGPLAPVLDNRYSGVRRAARLTPVNDRVVITLDGVDSYDNKGFFGDQKALDIFEFDFIYGNPSSALDDPASIILTKEKSEILFGDQNPIGKTLELNAGNLFTVTGIIDRPGNTHLDFNFIIPFEVNRQKLGQSSVWQDHNCNTYVQLREESDHKAVQEQIENILVERGAENIRLGLEPLKRSYLYSITGSGKIANVRLFTLIAVLVLLIACINFINLTTARAEKRSREVALRKVAGASRPQLIRQFLGESFAVTIIALVLSVLIIILILPVFNDIAGKSISLVYATFFLSVLLLSVAIITGLLSGLYPALILSSFKPVIALKGKKATKNGSVTLRTVLTVVQFILATGLIVATLIINRQQKYMSNKNLGFKKDNIAVLSLGREGRMRYGLFKDEIMRLPGVENVTMTNGLPNSVRSSTNGVSWPGKGVNENKIFYLFNAGHDFSDVFNIELAEGRTWKPDLVADSMKLIINQTAAREMSLDNPTEEIITLWGDNYEVIGVVRDFNFQDLSQEVKPLLILMSVVWQNNICISLKPDLIASTVKEIENKWNDIYPEQLFDLSFFDTEFDNVYNSETRMRKLFSIFSLLALIISSLGLFGLATFMAEYRFREIAIRKVLGASEDGLVWKMVWGFIKWVLVANITGSLIALLVMRYWLNSYAYKIRITIDIFLISSFVAIIIAFITVLTQSLRASRKNPVEVLASE